MIDLVDRILELIAQECKTTTARFVTGARQAYIDAHGKAVVMLVNGIELEYPQQVGQSRRWVKRIVTVSELKRAVRVVWAGNGRRWDETDVPSVTFSDVLAIMSHASHGMIQLK